MSYVLDIKANDFVEWSKDISARHKFAVLLRILIHSTGNNLQKVDFPGNDDAERPGWDGLIEYDTNTAWIPAGESGWEFGVNKDFKSKADKDYKKNIEATKEDDRSNITFVFVTLKKWFKKKDWVKERKSLKDWKDVRAYDASDLEQWIEQSPVAQVWFADQIGRPSKGIRSLERCWDDWAKVTDPVLDSAFFDSAVKEWTERIQSFLKLENKDSLVIGADSVEEALAFLSQVLDKSELRQYKDRVLVFDKKNILSQLAQSTIDFIAVIHTREIERELGPYSASLKNILVYPRNAIPSETKNPILLKPIGFESFAGTLGKMGKSRDEIKRLSNESGRSLTVLRRRLANISAIKQPEWVENDQTVQNLIPFVLIGAWDSGNKADQEILSDLAQKSFEDLERCIVELLQLNDSPLWQLIHIEE